MTREPSPGSEPVISLVDWLEASEDELNSRYERLYVPRNDPKYLKRNARIVLRNAERS